MKLWKKQVPMHTESMGGLGPSVGYGKIGS